MSTLSSSKFFFRLSSDFFFFFAPVQTATLTHSLCSSGVLLFQISLLFADDRFCHPDPTRAQILHGNVTSTYMDKIMPRGRERFYFSKNALPFACG
jgi:hypothetical protein